jgi:hypothetical protein
MGVSPWISDEVLADHNERFPDRGSKDTFLHSWQPTFKVGHGGYCSPRLIIAYHGTSASVSCAL